MRVFLFFILIIMCEFTSILDEETYPQPEIIENQNQPHPQTDADQEIHRQETATVLGADYGNGRSAI